MIFSYVQMEEIVILTDHPIQVWETWVISSPNPYGISAPYLHNGLWYKVSQSTKA